MTRVHSLNIMNPITWEVFAEDWKAGDYWRCTFWITVFNHDIAWTSIRSDRQVTTSSWKKKLTEHFCRVEPFKPARTSNKLVARKASIGILESEQEIHWITHSFLRYKFWGKSAQSGSKRSLLLLTQLTWGRIVDTWLIWVLHRYNHWQYILVLSC